MTLTQQFLIVSILPLSFAGMLIYLWRAGLKRLQLLNRWSLTLVLSGLWASSVLRFFGGIAFPPALTYSWGVIAHYMLTLAALMVLLTTAAHVSLSPKRTNIAIVLSVGLGAFAFLLDPAIWGYQVPDFTVAGQSVRYFDAWAAVWVTSWLTPLLAARILTQKIRYAMPKSLYRNQLDFWVWVLNLFLIGAGLASIQQPNQSGWLQAGVLVIALAALTGTFSIARSQLPDLQLALRLLLSRLSGTLIIFGITWLALSWITSGVTTLNANSASRNLVLILSAALFAGLFTIVYRFVNDLTRRLFLPALSRRESDMSNYANAIGNFPEPVQLGQLFLRILHSNLAVDDSWFMMAEDGPAGRLVLRPLASLNSTPPDAADFAADSPFTTRLRRERTPLVQYDVDAFAGFDEMAEAEKKVLAEWQRVLFMPLHAGDSLVGVLALGSKVTGELFDRADFEMLQSLAAQISPLLALAQNMVSLRQINDYVFEQNQNLARQNRHLQALVALYSQFLGLISPDLKQPYVDLSRELQQLEDRAGTNAGEQKAFSRLDQKVSALGVPIDRLITVAAKIQPRHDFQFELLQLEDVAREAIRNLQTMAEARRVNVELNADLPLPAILGDSGQLVEAVQHLLHNAIKFNKLGGVVQVECGLDRGELFLRVVDTGVGIPDERLGSVWHSFDGMKKFRNGRGTGLGLALARFIVDAHGGHVEVQSKYGAGSVFSIHLPLAYEAQD